MFLIKGKTERSSFGVGVESATEALAQRRQLIERQMTVEVMDVRGQLVSLEDLQWLADAEARFAKTARRE